MAAARPGSGRGTGFRHARGQRRACGDSDDRARLIHRRAEDDFERLVDESEVVVEEELVAVQARQLKAVDWRVKLKNCAYSRSAHNLVEHRNGEIIDVSRCCRTGDMWTLIVQCQASVVAT
jgi:hypothetical protein